MATLLRRLHALQPAGPHVGATRTMVYRMNENGPKPRKVFGLIWNSKVSAGRSSGRRRSCACRSPRLSCSQIVVFYAALFTIPTIMTFAYTGGRTQLSREDLLKSAVAKDSMGAVT